MGRVIDVNTDELINLTAKLERLNRHSYPSAVRNTLNDIAFKSKTLIPKSASIKFTIRQRNLFKNISRVNRAKGFSVNNMFSEIKLEGKGRNSLIEALGVQNKGGTINSKLTTAFTSSRIGKNNSRKIRRNYYLNKVDAVSKGKKVKGANFIMVNTRGSKIKATIYDVSNGKFLPVYMIRKQKKKRFRPRPFMDVAVKKASSLAESFYVKNADFQIKKYLK